MKDKSQPELRELLEITFGELSFDAIVCLDANLPGADFYDLFPGMPLLAADGAGLQLSDMGVIPDYIIGDLDTFNSKSHQEKLLKTILIQIPEQETTDFEKILNFALDNNYMNILILGFHGGELEHTLNNWSVLVRYSRKMNLCIWDAGRYAIPVSSSIEIKLEQNETVSIIPQPKTTLTTDNLKWELNKEKLELGVREGARNIAILPEIRIFLHSGEYILFINARLPFAPEKKILNSTE
jgi:thiamine pyrophosphokinase